MKTTLGAESSHSCRKRFGVLPKPRVGTLAIRPGSVADRIVLDTCTPLEHPSDASICVHVCLCVYAYVCPLALQCTHKVACMYICMGYVVLFAFANVYMSVYARICDVCMQ